MLYLNKGYPRSSPPSVTEVYTIIDVKEEFLLGACQEDEVMSLTPVAP